MRGKFATFIASVPHKRIASIGRVLGMLMYGIDVRHRRIVRRNLKFVYPEWPPERVNKVSKRVFSKPGHYYSGNLSDDLFFPGMIS